MYREIYADGGYVCATWRNVIINFCETELTLESLAAGREAGARLEEEFGPRVGVITVISSSFSMPSDEVRRQAARDMEAAGHRVKASATVITGSGFRASAFRTAFATLTLFSRSSAPTKVARTIEEGAQFVVDTLELDDPYAKALTTAVRACGDRLAELRGESDGG